MKTLSEYAAREEYYTSNIISEGLKEWLKQFWGWLTNTNNKSEYDVSSKYYDEGKMKKYISSHNTSSVKHTEIDEDHVKIAIHQSGADDEKNEKCGFWRTRAYMDTQRYIDNKNIIQWHAWTFDSDDLRQVCALMAYYKDPNYNYFICTSFDDDSRFKGVLDFDKIADIMTKIAKKQNVYEIHLNTNDNNRLIKLFNSTRERFSKKGVYMQY